jgi:hypothetical protein
LLNKLRGAEKTLLASYESQAGNDFAISLLKSPDMFYAVSMMKKSALFFGNGDF